MLERLTSFASDVAIERDWLTQLVGRPNLMQLFTIFVSLSCQLYGRAMLILISLFGC